MTRLLEQYRQTCAAFPQAVVLIRVGDFYEAYEDRAIRLAETLGLTLTRRDGVLLSGIPLHMVEKRVAQLLTCGRQVLLMEHAEDPHGKAPAEVTRQCVRFLPKP